MEQRSSVPWVVKVRSVNDMGEIMNLLGEAGWELVTSVATVKTWLNMNGNDLVFVFRKAGQAIA